MTAHQVKCIWSPVKPGRHRTDATLIAELQAELTEHCRDYDGKVKQYDLTLRVAEWLTSRGVSMGYTTILRQIVVPVCRKLWPRSKR